MVIKEALREGNEILKNADIESFLTDSLILLCFSLGISKEQYILKKDNEIKYEDYNNYISYIKQRALKFPVKYITGRCEFMGLDFSVEPGVLIPRPDTETLVEEALKLFSSNSDILIADLCCGSGCIGLSLTHFLKNAKLFAYDISDIALKLTLKNAEALNLSERTSVIKKDILSEAEDKMFDLIVSNPPYISSYEYKNLMDDVRMYEPEIALHSPDDDIKFYRRIISFYTKNLKEKGYLLFEVGYNQAKRVMELIDETHLFYPSYSVCDLNGINRVVVARKAN